MKIAYSQRAVLIRTYYPGVFLCVLISIAAVALSAKYLAPAMILAVLLGMALNSISSSQVLKPGIDWSAKSLLSIGIALLGLRVDFNFETGSGWFLAMFPIILFLLTFAVGYLLAKYLSKNSTLAVLIASSVAIYGVSAAVAVYSVLPAKKRKESYLAISIAAITVRCVMNASSISRMTSFRINPYRFYVNIS